MDVVIAQGMASENGVAKTSNRVSRVATSMTVAVVFCNAVVGAESSNESMRECGDRALLERPRKFCRGVVATIKRKERFSARGRDLKTARQIATWWNAQVIAPSKAFITAFRMYTKHSAGRATKSGMCKALSLSLLCLASIQPVVVAAQMWGPIYELEEGVGNEVCEGIRDGVKKYSENRRAKLLGMPEVPLSEPMPKIPKWEVPRSPDEPVGPFRSYLDYLWENEVNQRDAFRGPSKQWRGTKKQREQAYENWIGRDYSNLASPLYTSFDIDNDGVLDWIWRGGGGFMIIVKDVSAPCPTCFKSPTWDRERTLRVFQHKTWKERGGERDPNVPLFVSNPSLISYGLVSYNAVNYFTIRWNEGGPTGQAIFGRDSRHEVYYRMHGDRVDRVCSFRISDYPE